MTLGLFEARCVAIGFVRTTSDSPEPLVRPILMDDFCHGCTRLEAIPRLEAIVLRNKEKQEGRKDKKGLMQFAIRWTNGIAMVQRHLLRCSTG